MKFDRGRTKSRAYSETHLPNILIVADFGGTGVWTYQHEQKDDIPVEQLTERPLQTLMVASLILKNLNRLRESCLYALLPTQRYNHVQMETLVI